MQPETKIQVYHVWSLEGIITPPKNMTIYQYLYFTLLLYTSTYT
jgi:hypothetical protein